MRKNQLKIAPIVAAVLVLALLLTYFLMSGTMNSVNDVTEQEALALLTENAVRAIMTLFLWIYRCLLWTAMKRRAA